MNDISEYSKDRIPTSEINKDNYIGVDNLLQNKKGKVESNYVPTSGNLTKFYAGNILIGNIRPYLRKIWLADCIGGTNGDVLAIGINESFMNQIMPEYLYQFLSSENFFEYDIKHSRGAKMPRGNKQKIMEFRVLIPSLSVQQHIVNILDNFDSLINDVSEGLPKEIELRQKQYEYYREKLLKFSDN